MKNQNWNYESVNALYEVPFLDLIQQAYVIHKQHSHAGKMQLSTLLSIKTGNCPEDCAYCPQSARYNTGVERQELMDVDDILTKARHAKANGATRFCMGASWRSLPDRAMDKMVEIIKQVKELGLETCMTLGMLNQTQAETLKTAGLDYYNHNLDSSPEFYQQIITTRNYQDRLDTLKTVHDAQIKVCCGGILGMGETRADRINFLLQIAGLPKPPESLPLNRLAPVKGTPLENSPVIDNFEFIRTIAIARIMFPESVIRLSAGRSEMSEEMHTLCFMAGVSSIHFGEVLLTTANPETNKDLKLLEKLGIAALC